MSIFLNDVSVTCALGHGNQAVREGLFSPTVGGVTTTSTFLNRPLAVGRIEAHLPDSSQWPLGFRSRNNQLFAAVIEPLRARIEAAAAAFGRPRVACIVGTSTSGIAEGQLAIAQRAASGRLPEGFSYRQQEIGNPADFAAFYLKVGLTTVVSTACSSSAKALATGARLLNAGLFDVVIAGGVDTLCDFTIAGFSALESVSETRCNPLSRNRRGINIGEAGAFFVMSKQPGPVRLAGWGETSDAHHMSAPEPSGRGARDAMQLALTRGQVTASQVDYVNLHGTATVQNDAMESRAVAELLGHDVPVSSTKPLTGHTLGAAGALEAALCWLTMTDAQHRLPPHHWDGEADESLPRLTVARSGTTKDARVVMSNSFAFGGNNAALVFVRE